MIQTKLYMWLGNGDFNLEVLLFGKLTREHGFDRVTSLALRLSYFPSSTSCMHIIRSMKYLMIII